MREIETPLEMARRHVFEGSRLVAEQSALIARMAPDNELIGPAQTLLDTLQVTLVSFKADLARLEDIAASTNGG